MKNIELGWKTKVALLVPVVYILVSGICFMEVPGLDLMAFLVAGWALYMRRVWPQIQVRWDLVASAGVYAVLLLAGSHLFLRWLYREMSKGRWRFGWTLAGFLIVLLMFVAGTAAVGVVHQVTWLARSPRPMFHRVGHARVLCQTNLTQIGQAITLYADEHGGRCPDDLSALVEQGLRPRGFVCPSSDDDEAAGATPQEIVAKLHEPGHCSYFYFGKGLRWPAGDDRVIAVEPLSNHEDMIIVLYGDGHTDWLPEPQATQLLTKLGIEKESRGRIEPVTRPATRP